MTETNPSQQIIDKVTAHLKAVDGVFTLKAPIMATLLMVDGKYKNKNLAGGTEFLFSGVREGVRSQFIFEFEPVDSQPFKQMELDEKKVFDTFPDLEPMLCHALGYSEDTGWPSAKRKFVAAAKREIEKAKKEEQAKAEAETAAVYADDDTWGSW